MKTLSRIDQKKDLKPMKFFLLAIALHLSSTLNAQEENFESETGNCENASEENIDLNGDELISFLAQNTQPTQTTRSFACGMGESIVRTVVVTCPLPTGDNPDSIAVPCQPMDESEMQVVCERTIRGGAPGTSVSSCVSAAIGSLPSCVAPRCPRCPLPPFRICTAFGVVSGRNYSFAGGQPPKFKARLKGNSSTGCFVECRGSGDATSFTLTYTDLCVRGCAGCADQ